MIPAIAPLSAPRGRPGSQTRLDGGPHVITVAWPGSRVAEVRLLLPVPCFSPAATVLARLLPQLPVLGGPSVGEAVAELGGELEAAASCGWLTLGAYALEVHLADLLGLLGALRATPLPRDLIAAVTATAARAARADAARADVQARRLLLGDIQGPTAETLSALGAAQIQEAWDSCSAARLLCVGAGHDETVELAAAWPSWPAVATPAPGTGAPDAGFPGRGAPGTGAPGAGAALGVRAGDRLLADLPGATQATIGLAGPAPALTDPAWAGFTLAHTAFGAMPTSRIMRSLRETHGYTYSPYSFVEQHDGRGYHIATIAVSAEAAEPALRVLLDDLAGIGAAPPSGAELETARRSAVGRLMRTTHTPRGLADHLACLLRGGVPAPAFDGLIQDLIDADCEQVAAGARRLCPQDSSLVIVGDTGRLAQSLEGGHDTWMRCTGSAR